MSRAAVALRRDGRVWFGGVVIALVVLVAVAAPLVSRHDPITIDLPNQLSAPSAAHWMGTDVQGRDVWARLVYGARVSLGVGLASQALALSLGLTLGLLDRKSVV